MADDRQTVRLSCPATESGEHDFHETCRNPQCLHRRVLHGRDMHTKVCGCTNVAWWSRICKACGFRADDERG